MRKSEKGEVQTHLLMLDIWTLPEHFHLPTRQNQRIWLLFVGINIFSVVK
jgi:hypothetical protein